MQQSHSDHDDDDTGSSSSSNNSYGVDSNNHEIVDQQQQQSPPKTRKKQHTLSVCMVPPPPSSSGTSRTIAWTAVTRARTECKDPGLFRWPPHVNLLYPFVEINNDLEVVTNKLRDATKQCRPFHVSLGTFGTFGGDNKNRGGGSVLWLYPRSYHDDTDYEISSSEVEEAQPLIKLQALLQEQFPMCTEQRKNNRRRYHPHMTVGHFASLGDAQIAQRSVESWWPTSNDVSFRVNQIYLLQRKGDGGQFMRLVTLSLGEEDEALVDDSDSSPSSSCSCNIGIKIHDPPIPFPDMPTTEEDWVRAERMKLKERRNNSWKGRRRRRGGGKI